LSRLSSPILLFVAGLLAFFGAFVLHARQDSQARLDVASIRAEHERLRVLDAMARRFGAEAAEDGPSLRAEAEPEAPDALAQALRDWRADPGDASLARLRDAIGHETRARDAALRSRLDAAAAGPPGGLDSWQLATVASAILLSAVFALYLRDRRHERVMRERGDEALHSLQSLLAAAPFAFVAWSREHGVVLWSDTAERMFGIARADAVGAPLPPALGPVQRAVDEALQVGGPLTTLQVDLVSASGQTLQTTVSATRIGAAGAEPVTTAAVIEDATPRRLLESRRLDAVRAQRDALIREVHHRIKNNLQGVAGLLRRHLAGKPLLQPLLEAATSQVLSIAAVHGLQGELQGGVLDLRAMVSRIAASISGIMHVPIVLGERCAQLQGTSVAEEEAVAVAMVLNEIMMNAVKHRQRRDGDSLVGIDARRDAQGASIVVTNPGFLPPRFNFALGVQIGTGLELVRSLLPQRGARLEIEERDDVVVATLSLSFANVLRSNATVHEIERGVGT
jgi:two-component sensor histidine kinase